MAVYLKLTTIGEDPPPILVNMGSVERMKPNARTSGAVLRFNAKESLFVQEDFDAITHMLEHSKAKQIS